MKSWLAQGSSGRRVTLLPGTTFLHINGALRLLSDCGKSEYEIGRMVRPRSFLCTRVAGETWIF